MRGYRAKREVKIVLPYKLRQKHGTTALKPYNASKFLVASLKAKNKLKPLCLRAQVLVGLGFIIFFSFVFGPRAKL